MRFIEFAAEIANIGYAILHELIFGPEPIVTKTDLRTDAQKLAGDWEKIGRDMRDAMEKYGP